MPGNIKALTNEELKFALGKYAFEMSGDYVVVKVNNRRTVHPADKAFSLLLPLERRRIKVTPKAISLWEKRYLERYSLLEVQNAINTLAVMFQNMSEANIDAQLKRARSKLDNLYKEGE